MIRSLRVVRESARHVGDAIEEVVSALRERRVEQEPDFTSRMLGAIEKAMDNYKVGGIVWISKTLTDRGRGAQEKEYGADFVGVLSIGLEEFEVKKGFLAQGKLIEPGNSFLPSESVRLREQCKKMLDVTPDSFVFLYSKGGVTVVPAVSYAGAKVNPYELYNRSATRFFEEHFESFIGDPKIQVTDTKALDKIRSDYNARSLLFLGARSVCDSQRL